MEVEFLVGSLQFSPLLKINNSKLQFDLEHTQAFLNEFLWTPKFLEGNEMNISQ